MGARGNGVPLLERGEVPAGSVRSTSGGFAAVVRCPFER